MHYEVVKSKKNLSRLYDILLRGNVLDNNLQLEVIMEYEEKEISEKLHLTDKLPYMIKHREVLYETIISSKQESTFYQLQPITEKDLYKIRMNGTPGVVYKKDDLLFWCKIPTSLSINRKATSLGKHLCSGNCTQVCRGCPRTSALTTAYQQRIGKTFAQAVFASWRIEKYPFITEGLEAFNMPRTNDAFLVIKCNHYVMGHSIDERRTPSNSQRLSLASFYWEDFNGTLAQMRKRINENEEKYGDLSSF